MIIAECAVSFNPPTSSNTFFFLHQVHLDKIQRVINCTACLIFKVPKSAHITPFLYNLLWLPISSQIQYKIALICFQIVSGTAPQYLSEFLHIYSPSHSLCSAVDTRIFCVPRKGKRTLWERSFLSLSGICLHSLKSKLKSHLFSSAY